jgi:hypothetical protein
LSGSPRRETLEDIAQDEAEGMDDRAPSDIVFAMRVRTWPA